jgi:hypothetical protein
MTATAAVSAKTIRRVEKTSSTGIS